MKIQTLKLFFIVIFLYNVCILTPTPFIHIYSNIHPSVFRTYKNNNNNNNTKKRKEKKAI